jgi:hypothetical protein
LFVDHTKKGEPPENGNRLENAGVLVEKLWWTDIGEGVVEVRFDGTVLNKGKGEIIGGILEAGGTLGFSKRGGTNEWKPVKTKQYGEVYQPVPYKFMAWDVVTGQSVAEARTESKQAIFETEHHEEKIMELSEVKKDAALWTQITEAVRLELAPAFEQTVTDRIKAATDELKTTVEASFQPYKAASETLNTAMTSIVAALKGAGLIDDRAATEVEKGLTEKVTALETAAKDKDAQIKALEAEIAKLKGPARKPLDKKAVETFFMGQPGGKAVLEHLGEKEFYAEDEMTSAYAGMKAIATAVLETSNAGAATPKGKVDKVDETIPKDEKDQAREDLKKRAGK